MFTAPGQIWIEKTEHVCVFDNANTFLFLEGPGPFDGQRVNVHSVAQAERLRWY